MTNSFLIQNKRFLLPLLILVPLNILIFIEPLRISLLTSQADRFVYYLILYFTATLTPSLLIFGIFRKNALSIASFLILILVLIIFNIGMILVEKSKIVAYKGEQINDKVYLDYKNIKSEDAVKNTNFCFKIFLPTYLPSKPYPMKFRNAALSTKECRLQLVILNYGFNLTEIPKNYDFNFRKGFEDLKSLREEALSGTQISVGTRKAYISDLKRPDEGFPVLSGVYTIGAKGKLIYQETGETLIFLRFEPNEIYPESEYIKIMGSLSPIN